MASSFFPGIGTTLTNATNAVTAKTPAGQAYASDPSVGQNIYDSVNNPSLDSGPPPTSPINPYSDPSVNLGVSPYAPAPTYMDPSTLGPTSPGTTPMTTANGQTYGTESGPGIMQQWFGERATGTDPGYEYATGRGMKALDGAFAARGGYNSGANIQADSDYLANMGSQREGQLDSLASGASGERANSLSTMLGLDNSITGGMAGLTSGYDLGAANALNTGNAAALQLGINGAMAGIQGKQGLMNNLFSIGGLAML